MSAELASLVTSIAQRAREQAMHETDPEERQKICEYEIVKVSLTNLMSFPWVAQLVERGALQLHGAYFGVGDGVLMVRGAGGEFERLVD